MTAVGGSMSGRDFREHVLDFYNRSPRFYELSEFMRAHTRERLVSLSRCRPGERMLDVCAGTGELARAFSRSGVAVTAIDLARGMLRHGQGKPGRALPTYVEMDAARLAFPDKVFDVSAISLALHHMPQDEQVRVLSELKRVTRRCALFVEPHAPFRFNRRLLSLWGSVASVFDESEHMREWAHQDFTSTCQSVGLRVEHVEVLTLNIHRITVCTVS